MFMSVSVSRVPRPSSGTTGLEMSLVSRCVKQFQSKCNFSIDHILNVAGEKTKVESFNPSDDEERKFEWLNCTRYRPPKLQRQRKRDGIQRRKLGRNPRIPFSSSQVALLEAKFVRTPYLSSSDVTQLATNLHLSETRVKIWFQNRRARERRDRETKSKVAEAAKEAALQNPVHNVKESIENGYLERYFHQEDVRGRECKTSGGNLGDGNGGYIQYFTPLDLSERHLNVMHSL